MCRAVNYCPAALVLTIGAHSSSGHFLEYLKMYGFIGLVFLTKDWLVGVIFPGEDYSQGLQFCPAGHYFSCFRDRSMPRVASSIV